MRQPSPVSTSGLSATARPARRMVSRKGPYTGGWMSTRSPGAVSA